MATFVVVNAPGSGRTSSDAAGSSKAQFILRKRGPLHLQDGEAAPIRHLLSHEQKLGWPRDKKDFVSVVRKLIPFNYKKIIINPAAPDKNTWRASDIRIWLGQISLFFSKAH